MKLLCQQIRDKRLLLGLTQAEMALEIGVTVQTYCSWEKGSKPTKNNVKRLNKYFAEHKPAWGNTPPKTIQEMQHDELLCIKNNQIKIIHLLEKIHNAINKLCEIGSSGKRGETAGATLKESLARLSRKDQHGNQV